MHERHPQQHPVGHEPNVVRRVEGVPALHGHEHCELSRRPGPAIAGRVIDDRHAPDQRRLGDGWGGIGDRDGLDPDRGSGGSSRSEAGEVGQKRRGPRPRGADEVGGDGEDHGGDAANLESGQVGLAQIAGPQRSGAVRLRQVVAEKPRPDEGLDVEVDHFAGPVQLERRRRDGQPAAAAAIIPARPAELAFHFRYIPANERQLRSAGSRPRSGVRFPLYPGKRTPVVGDATGRYVSWPRPGWAAPAPPTSCPGPASPRRRWRRCSG